MMHKFFVILNKELLEQWRTKRILILTVVFLFVAIASPIFAKLTPELLKSISVPGMSIKLPEPTYKDSLDQFIKNTSQIALLALVFVVAGAISDEKNRKTLEIVLTKSVSRAMFVLAKFKSYFISISSVFLLSSALFYVYTVTTFSSFSFGNFLIMDLCVLLYILMIAAITILASTVVKSNIAAGAIGFVSFILFGTIFGMIETLKKYSPNMIFSNYKDVVANGWTSDLAWPTIITLVITLACVIIAILIFKNQEIER